MLFAAILWLPITFKDVAISPVLPAKRRRSPQEGKLFGMVSNFFRDAAYKSANTGSRIHTDDLTFLSKTMHFFINNLLNHHRTLDKVGFFPGGVGRTVDMWDEALKRIRTEVADGTTTLCDRVASRNINFGADHGFPLDSLHSSPRPSANEEAPTLLHTSSHAWDRAEEVGDSGAPPAKRLQIRR